jgi:hypothetical protein
MENSDGFWNNLFHKNRLTEFIPTVDMTTEERLNSLTRFVIYFSVLLFLYYKSFNILYLLLIAIALIYLVYMNLPKKMDYDFIGTHGDDDATCTRPNKNNPFMNVLITDYTENPNRSKACEHSDITIKNEVEKNFNDNLFKNVDDIWDRMNSQRQFYTMPGTTIPNDREKFMNWCWNTKYTCKEKTENCDKNYDLRIEKRHDV